MGQKINDKRLAYMENFRLLNILAVCWSTKPDVKVVSKARKCNNLGDDWKWKTYFKLRAEGQGGKDVGFKEDSAGGLAQNKYGFEKAGFGGDGRG